MAAYSFRHKEDCLTVKAFLRCGLFDVKIKCSTLVFDPSTGVTAYYQGMDAEFCHVDQPTC